MEQENTKNNISPISARKGGKIWTEKERRDGKVFMQKLIDQIYLHMQKAGVNYSSLAKKMCVSKPTVSQMFSGDVIWSFYSLMKVCDALDLDFQVILTPKKVK